MKTKTLQAPANASIEEKAAWIIYPDRQTGCMVSSQKHNRDRIIRLANGGYFANGDMTMASRRQRIEIKQFNDILATFLA